MKERLEEEIEEDESEKSRDVFVESIRNISNVNESIVVSDLIISKKLFNSSIPSSGQLAALSNRYNILL
jgi:hypothetical protein